MIFPLRVFLYLYLFLTGSVILFFLANLYHWIRFSFLNFKSVFVSFIFLAGLALLIYFSYQYLIQINWELEVPIFEKIEFKNIKLINLP
jgi:hypothetical protein